MARQLWIIVLAFLFVLPSLPMCARQDAGSSADPKAAPADSSSHSNSKHSHVNDLLIRGTVFDDRGLAVAGAQLRIRRANEKKNRWETYSNSRGEFAVRVRPGSDYEIEAESKGFAKQSLPVNGNDAGAEEKVIFHLDRVRGGKK